MKALIFSFGLLFLLINLKHINSLKLNKTKSSSNNCTLVSTLDNQRDEVASLLQLPNGDLAAGGRDGTINIWNLANETIISSLPDHEDVVNAMLILKNGSLVSGSSDGTIKIWDTASSTLLNSLDAEGDSISSLALLHDGSLASGYLNTNTIKIWNMTDGSIITRLIDYSYVTFLGTINDTYLVSCTYEQIKIRNTTDDFKMVEIIFDVYGRRVNSMVYLNNGSLISADENANINVWDLRTRNLINNLQGHTDSVFSLVLLGNGNLASSSKDQTIKIWSMKDGSLIQTLTEHTDWVNSLLLLQNGYLASGSDDTSIILWDCN